MHPEDLSTVLRPRRLHPCRCLDFGKSTALLERRRQRPFSAPGTSALCIKQEFQKDLLLRSFHGAFPIEETFSDPQAGALSQYIGKEEVTLDRTHIPLSLFPGDTLLLCSDGISDPLTLKQIREAMELPVQDCCSALEAAIRKAALPTQDNYTAIILHYYGEKENTE